MFVGFFFLASVFYHHLRRTTEETNISRFANIEVSYNAYNRFEKTAFLYRLISAKLTVELAVQL